ncbi:transcriptional regulator, AraC family [Singulisphaera sp. GP187]|uniref:helix-turn-helix domain-containing protein n=1 Tax=Singulisphaera sp. GP187 TaxID=1882752 RepID=UPI0009284655|nr:helix-turn-helix domain-containing protein [Singulisphaera sp. GP187]SIO64922.1 transcriptional regulator, AraC family [Singulisphaera sp. GP187]
MHHDLISFGGCNGATPDPIRNVAEEVAHYPATPGHPCLSGLEIVPMGRHDEGLADGLIVRRSSPLSPFVGGWHAHDFHQVTLFLSSPGHVEWHFSEGRAYSGRPAAGDLVLTPAIVPTLVRWDRPFEAVSVRFSTGLVDRVASQAGLDAARLRPAAMRHDPFAGEVTRKLADEAESGRVGPSLLAESLGTALAVHLLRAYADEGPQMPPRPNGLPNDDLRRVTDHIEGQLDGDLSLGRLAAVAGLSPYHFARLFRVATGTTPHQYVIRRRVERARELLRGGCDIALAAARVGFSGQSHLHHHVRRLLGVTPGELARRPQADGRPR